MAMMFLKPIDGSLQGLGLPPGALSGYRSGPVGCFTDGGLASAGVARSRAEARAGRAVRLRRTLAP